jgi:hypothetical protein
VRSRLGPSTARSTFDNKTHMFWYIFCAPLKRRCAAVFVRGTFATLRPFRCFFVVAFFGGPWGSLWGSFGSPWVTLGFTLGSFGSPWVTLGVLGDPFGATLASLGHPWGVFGVTLGSLEPLWVALGFLAARGGLSETKQSAAVWAKPGGRCEASLPVSLSLSLSVSLSVCVLILGLFC